MELTDLGSMHTHDQNLEDVLDFCNNINLHFRSILNILFLKAYAFMRLLSSKYCQMKNSCFKAVWMNTSKALGVTNFYQAKHAWFEFTLRKSHYT